MNTTLIKNKWKAKLVEGHVITVLPVEEFNKDDVNFLITMCANPQHIVEFPAYNEESAKRIANFMAKELKDHYPVPTWTILDLRSLGSIPVMTDGTNYKPVVENDTDHQPNDRLQVQ